MLKHYSETPACAVLFVDWVTDLCMSSPPLTPLSHFPPPPPALLTLSKLHSTSSSYLLFFLLLSFPPTGGCQGPDGGRAIGSGTQPGSVRHHGPTEAGRDQGADPPRDPQGAEDQRRCREPAQGNITDFYFTGSRLSKLFLEGVVQQFSIGLP